MKKKIITAAAFGLAFIVLMIFVCAYDVEHVGPRGTAVGFSTLNLVRSKNCVLLMLTHLCKSKICAHGAICTHSLTSKLAASFRLIM